MATTPDDVSSAVQAFQATVTDVNNKTAAEGVADTAAAQALATQQGAANDTATAIASMNTAKAAAIAAINSEAADAISGAPAPPAAGSGS